MKSWLRQVGLSLALSTTATMAVTFAVLSPSISSGEPSVYANPTDSPVDPGIAYGVAPDTDSFTFYLYVDAGTLPETGGTPCIDGDGEHLCAYEIDLQTLGDMSFNDFTGDPGVVWEMTDLDHVSIVFAEPAAPTLGPLRIGTFQVETAGSAGSVRLTGGGIVVGRLSWTDWEAEDLAYIAVPEPGFVLALVLSIGVLIVIRFLSARRRLDRLGGRRRKTTHARGDAALARASAVAPYMSVASLVLVGALASERAYAADPAITVDGRWSQMTAGLEHTCGILESGRIECFGDDTFGQISNKPKEVYTRLSAGENATCAIEIDGRITCWGGNTSEIGLGLLSPPLPPPGLQFISVSVGSLSACGVLSDRQVACWGFAQFPPPPTGPAVTEVAGGFEHTCARQPNGTPICWGLAPGGAATVPRAFANQPYKYVGTGDAHTCALRADGSVDCWGDAAFGKTTPPASLFERMSVGHEHSCGVRFDGGVECWGRNDSGEAPLSAGSDFVSVHAGDDHTCGIKTDRSAECWGDAAGGKSSPPKTHVADVAAGGAHSCGLRFDGRTVCWGSNSAGQLLAPTDPFYMIGAGRRHTCGMGGVFGTLSCWGDNSLGQATPPAVGLPIFRRITAGGNASCAIRLSISNDTPLLCWGDSFYDQDQPPAGDFVEVALGNRHGCAIRDDGTLACWGDPFSTSGKKNPPPGVFVEIAAGQDHSCGITSLGTVRCWGDNTFGQSASQSKIFTRIAAGRRHSCGILLSGRIRCWGDPSDGRTNPPPGLYEAISANEDHTCATRQGGGFACWGLPGGEVVPADDSDSDGLVDGIDNCPFVANADQADGDEDGAGDVCDVCPAFPDPEQLASYGDGVGDRCDASPRIELTPDVLSVNPIEALYDVHLDCTSSTITRITPEIVIPFFDPITGTPFATFGDGCGLQPQFCIGATGIGPTVDQFSSTAQFIQMGGPGREGTMQISMAGAPNLCTPGQRVFIGRLRVPGVTSFAVLPSPSSPDLNSSPVFGPGGSFGRPPVHSAGPLDPNVELSLVNQGNDRFALMLEADVEIHRLAIGIRVAPGGGPLVPVSFGPFVAANPDQNPPTMSDPPIRSDTYYIEFIGSDSNPFLPLDALNSPLAPIELMTFDHPMTLGLPPILELEGVDESFADSPLETALGDGVPLENVGFDFFTNGADTDADGFIDEVDNCAFAVNPLQSDSGGFADTDPNFRGDACECGDASGEGVITSALDPDGLRDFLADKPNPAPLTSELCSVSSGTECNALDLVSLEFAFQQTGPGLQNVCRGAVGTALLNGQ